MYAIAIAVVLVVVHLATLAHVRRRRRAPLRRRERTAEGRTGAIVRGDDRWLIVGGRSGRVKYTERELRAELPYEMGGGEVSMIIFGGSCEWTAPETRKMTAEEVRALARELASSIGRIEIAYPYPGVLETIDGKG